MLELVSSLQLKKSEMKNFGYLYVFPVNLFLVTADRINYKFWFFNAGIIVNLT